MAATALPNFGDVATPHLFGLFCNWALYGVLVVQTYLYYIAFPNDKLFVKIYAYTLVALETAQTGLLGRDGILMLGTGYGNPDMLDEVHLTWLSGPFLTSLVSILVQLFFAWRIFILSESYFVAIIISILSLFQGAAGMAQAIISLKLGRYSLIGDHTRVTDTTWLVGAAVVDVLIAGFMSYYLSSRKTGIRKTDNLITKLTRLSIETGSLTAILVVIDVILLLALPQKDYFATPAYVIAKLYTNNFMMILNSRIHILHGRNAAEATMDYTMSTFLAATGPYDSQQGSNMGNMRQRYRAGDVETTELSIGVQLGRRGSESIERDQVKSVERGEAGL